MPRPIAAFLAVFALAGTAPAAVVVVANATPEPVTAKFTHANGKTETVRIEDGDTAAVTVGKTVVLNLGTQTLTLDAYGAYVVVPERGGVAVKAVEMAGQPVPNDDVPADPPAAAKWKVPTAVLVDDADRRTRRVWEPVMKRRLETAGEVLGKVMPVTLELVAADEWPSTPLAADVPAVLADFEKAVKADGKTLYVGYTSRLIDSRPIVPHPFGMVRGPASSHVLLREADPRAETERVEVLVGMLARRFGAITSPDRASALRAKLGDGRALGPTAKIGIDPLNVLAMNLWADELRTGKVSKAADLSAATQARLGRVYATLAAAVPDETPGEEVAMLMAKAGVKPAVAVAPPPVVPVPRVVPPTVVPAVPAAPASAREEATRKVVKAVTAVAETNATLTKLRGDELTAHYVKAAADAAEFEPKDVRAAAFVLGLGLALDDSDILRKNPLAAKFCKQVESDDERKRRLAVLGVPTVRGRRDLCQHFVVSAALTELVGAGLAEQAGLAKEMLDMTKPSGFSFTDLLADFSGVRFAQLLAKKPELLTPLRQEFKVEDYMPKTDGLKDGLTEAKFKELYGGVGEPRFTKAVEELRTRVNELPAFKELPPAGK